MINVTDPHNCCGCSACASICAHGAIDMKPNALGFLYPQVEKSKCVECGLCEKVCAFNDAYETPGNFLQPIAFGSRHTEIAEIETSRSGATFIALSDKILEQGGVVYGAGHADHFRVVHKRATTKEERDEFKGSKYVQSDMGSVFRQVKKDLRDGLTVMFTGTPCQTSGLCSYVGKHLRENLVLLDIVCHGVPSPYIWHDYLCYLEKKQKKRITWVNFRDKQQFGWAYFIQTFKFEGEDEKKWFDLFYYEPILFRASCSNCHFTNTRRPSDITIGDFWGIEKIDATFNSDGKGCNLVFLNTEKGKQLFEAVKDQLNTIPVKLENCLQPNLQRPTAEHPARADFEEIYARKGFVAVMKKYGHMGMKYKLHMKWQHAKSILYAIKSKTKVSNLDTCR